jgi:hypothetical protein
MTLLLVLVVLILYGDFALHIRRTRTETALKVVSIDSEWQHYSTKVALDVFLMVEKRRKSNGGSTAVYTYALSCL